MPQESHPFYSKNELETLQNQGVRIPALEHVCIGREVPLENIHSGAVLHPFCRITGKNTKIHANAQIGLRGAAILEDSVVGSGSIIGNQGGVTLVKTFTGAQTILGQGEAEQAVFLGKETRHNDFTTGVGFRARKGSLYEEDASSAQHTDTKMTILFPWATLGSNVNLCDLLLAGGVGAKLGEFTEIGSGTIHFNYTIRGDKATGSLFGNVVAGVFLQEKRLFIGGNNSLLAPLQGEFGALTAAGLRVSGKLKEGLNLGAGFPTGHKEYDPRIFSRTKEIFQTQVHYVAQLAALHQWYQEVRLRLAPALSEKFQLYQAGLQMVVLNIQERIAQLERFVLALEGSIALLEQKNASPSVMEEQKHLLKIWPKVKQDLENYENHFQPIPPKLEEALHESAALHGSYTQIIQNLPTESVNAGKRWLQDLVTRCDVSPKHGQAGQTDGA